jgi:hypothetical protein
MLSFVSLDSFAFDNLRRSIRSRNECLTSSIPVFSRGSAWTRVSVVFSPSKCSTCWESVSKFSVPYTYILPGLLPVEAQEKLQDILELTTKSRQTLADLGWRFIPIVLIPLALRGHIRTIQEAICGPWIHSHLSR